MHRAPLPDTPHKSSAEQITAKLIYLVAIGGPFTATPQLYEIWFVDKSAQGVSILTWILFFAMSLIWFTYGAVRRDRPIMISNGLWAIMELFIIIGALRFFEDWL